ncbi:hypothetical protein ACT8ZV_05505 [Nocardioides sp. MAHUQ-72]|uniref:hypothetical protein n=1 Tax=unclassified Nocardioides TaxID=2615069 RepID=UPI00360BCE40
MTTTLREALARRIDEIGPAVLDVDALVGLGERRLRRRRITAVLAAGAAVVVAIALAVGLALTGPTTRDQGPVDRPAPDTDHRRTDDPAPLGQPREVVYRDVGRRSGTVHVGGHALETGRQFEHIDVTDDGLVYTTTDGRLWFSDGGPPVQVAAQLCGRSWDVDPNSHYQGLAEEGMVMSGNTGSLVAWFECSPGAVGTLVGLDTDTGREVVRDQIPACAVHRRPACSLTAVVGEHVYVTVAVERRPGRWHERLVVVDAASGRHDAATPAAYAADLRSQPRGLVVGGSWRTGTATDGIGQQLGLVGRRLVPVTGEGGTPTRAFDTVTGRPVWFRLPAGYHPEPSDECRWGSCFTTFEWLDDDAVALFGASSRPEGDVLTCRLSDRSCRLAAQAPPAASWRSLPDLPLPG